MTAESNLSESRSHCLSAKFAWRGACSIELYANTHKDMLASTVARAVKTLELQDKNRTLVSMQIAAFLTYLYFS